MKPKQLALLDWPPPDKPRWVSGAAVDAHYDFSPSTRGRLPNAPVGVRIAPRLVRYWSGDWDRWEQERRLATTAAAAAPEPLANEPPSPESEPVRKIVRRGRKLVHTAALPPPR
jgi:hypothetical protein